MNFHAARDAMVSALGVSGRYLADGGTGRRHDRNRTVIRVFRLAFRLNKKKRLTPADHNRGVRVSFEYNSVTKVERNTRA